MKRYIFNVALLMLAGRLAAAPDSTAVLADELSKAKAKEPPRKAAEGPNIPTSQYTTQTVAGWTVHVNRALLTTERQTGSNALALLEKKLNEIRQLVPARALVSLEKVPLWIGTNDFRAPNANYHPSIEWLRANGFNPDKARCVEIPNAEIFVSWSKSQPMMVLHELAHSYHHQVLGFNHAGVKEAYEAAKKSGKYEAVKRYSGKVDRAYALNNANEYFAEITEAYFGRNDYYPFVREELLKHDPAGFKLLEEVWGVKDVTQTPPSGTNSQ